MGVQLTCRSHHACVAHKCLISLHKHSLVKNEWFFQEDVQLIFNYP